MDLQSFPTRSPIQRCSIFLNLLNKHLIFKVKVLILVTIHLQEDIEKFKQENPDVAVVKKTVLSKEEQLLKDK